MKKYLGILTGIFLIGGMAWGQGTSTQTIVDQKSDVKGGSAVDRIGTMESTSMATPAAVTGTLPKKAFVGLGFAGAFNNFDTDVDYDDTWAMKFFGGYQFNPYLSVMAEFTFTGDFEAKESARVYYYYYYTTIEAKATANAYALSVNLKGYPIPEGIVRPYGLVGCGYAWTHQEIDIDYYDYHDTKDDSAFFFRIGAGAGFYVSPQVCLEAEVIYNMPTGDLDDAPFTQLGANCMLLF